MKTYFATFLFAFLISCSKTVYYQSCFENETMIRTESYTELQFHSDGLYESYNYNNSCSGSTAEVENGNFYISEDTLFVKEYYKHELENNQFLIDSNFIYCYFVKKEDSLFQYHNYNFNKENPSILTGSFKKGKSRILRKMERKNALIWEYTGNREFDLDLIYHGLKGHTDQCKYKLFYMK